MHKLEKSEEQWKEIFFKIRKIRCSLECFALKLENFGLGICHKISLSSLPKHVLSQKAL